MRTSPLTRVTGIWLLVWALLAITAFIATAWGAWQHANALYPTDSYTNERFLRASDAWPTVAALSVIVALPFSAVSLMKGRTRLILVLLVAIGLIWLGLAAGGIFIDIGTPGPGDPANL